MVIKKFGVDFDSMPGALTLRREEIDETDEKLNGFSIRVHLDGWTISGEIKEDYYSWVNEFTAMHPLHGKVWGNFEEEVFADTEEGYQDFYKNHKPEAWDYGDI